MSYPKFDNQDILEVPLVDGIPSDYDGVMAVPITFLDRYSPEQFEIVGRDNAPIVNGQRIFKRLLIRRK